ncbi:MAG: hypothetical protein PHY30_00530 [Candidatus Pacebacteria bacterium]|nr:hypothetical protein [Candidatus Paceibacterota bacterium]
MENITYYTQLILSPEIQTLLEPYRNVFILVSVFFFFISFILIFNEKYYLSDVKRRVVDFLSDPKKNKKPRKFVKIWLNAEKHFKEGKHKRAIIALDYLMIQVLKRCGCVGKDCCALIDDYGLREGAIPNLENVRKISNLKKAIAKGEEVELEREEMQKIFDLAKDTLIKLTILDK